MTDREDSPNRVDKFLLDQIDTVPHLEALLLIWNSRPKLWSVEEMAKALFVVPTAAKIILDDLMRERLIVSDPWESGGYLYEPDVERDQLLASVDSTYRRELIRISRLIHSKPPAAVRDFAKAFRLKKDQS